MTDPTIEDIPDYAALRQIQSALWKTGEVRGAAVMVGAGFSRFAERVSATTPLAPLWRDLSELMTAELYPQGNGTSDPLMLAQEYKSTLGPTALENLLRGTVRDKEWLPGELHSSLLRLPWEDVMTTNWDTLLEREAADNPDRPYEMVLTVQDIARARRPRIIKLHGSLPSHMPFILTEEDFRTYPVKFAPFVNTAQQILLENELCLVGFSGDDPNFLQWAGWVRDKLGSSARPIRLVGVLNLSPSRRRLLEGRNITPIDLAPLVLHLAKDDQHRAATEIFLDAFWAARPGNQADWKINHESPIGEGVTDPTVIATLILERWKAEREAHPGWLVTPRHTRTWIEAASRRDTILLSKALSAVSESLRAQALFEAVWRYETAYEQLPTYLEDDLSEMVSIDGDIHLTIERRTAIRTVLVAMARRRRAWEAVEQRLGWLEALATLEAQNEALYQKCLRARDSIDFAFLAEHVDQITGIDPVWLLRKGALQAESGRTREAGKTFREARLRIRQARANDKENLWLLSREAWTNLLVLNSRGVGDTEDDTTAQEIQVLFDRKQTDPWVELRGIDEMLRKSEKDRAEHSVDRVQGFDAGFYTIYGRGRNDGEQSAEAAELIQLADSVGIPLRVRYSDIIRTRFSDALALVMPQSPTFLWQAMRVALVSPSKELDKFFSRAAVAAIPLETVDEMITAIRAAIDFSLTQSQVIDQEALLDWNGKLMVLLELLSRLLARLPPPKVRELLDYAAEIFKNRQNIHIWLLEPFDNLFKRIVTGLGPTLDSGAYLILLQIPLPAEKQISGAGRRYPEPFSVVPTKRDLYGRQQPDWSARIHELIKLVASGDNTTREHSLFRLVRLTAADALSVDEKALFADALWVQVDDNGMPDRTGLLEHVFLDLPTPSSVNIERLFVKAIVEPIIAGKVSWRLAQALHGSAVTLTAQPRRPLLAQDQALQILTSFVDWLERQDPETDELGQEQAVSFAICLALVTVVLPRIPPNDVNPATEALVQRLLNRSAIDTAPELLIVGPQLTLRDPKFAVEAFRNLRKGLASRKHRTIQASLNGVYWALRNLESHSIPDFIAAEVTTLCLSERRRELHHALDTACLLVKNGAVDPFEQRRMVDALDIIGSAHSYSSGEYPKELADTGLIRASAIRLAAALTERGVESEVLRALIASAPTDPLPEVRFAVEDVYNDD